MTLSAQTGRIQILFAESGKKKAIFILFVVEIVPLPCFSLFQLADFYYN